MSQLRSVGSQKPRQPMTCDQARRYMTTLNERYATQTGMTGVGESLTFAAHLKNCSACQAEYRQMLSTGFVGHRDDEIFPDEPSRAEL